MTHRRLHVGMAVYGDITHDSRVQREASSLVAAGHAVTLFCLAWSSERTPRFDGRVEVAVVRPDRSGVVPGTASPFLEHRSRSRLRRLWGRVGWLIGYVRNLRAWGRTVVERGASVDAWHLHDFAALVAVAPHVSSPAVYDVHDLFTETGTGRRLPGVMRRAARWYERRLVSRVALVVAVNDGIAEDVARRCRARRLVVVHNAAPRWDPPASRPDLLRERLSLAPGTPVVLYHGLFSRWRGIERLCEAMLEPELAHAHLALLGYGQARDALAELAAEARFGGRIHVLDAVAPEELLPWVASADVGAMALPPATRNLVLATPNKLFECLAAGTPPVVSDLPLMRRIVMDDPLGPLGAVCDPDDPRSVALAIAAILELDGTALAALRERCLTAARERWNWETEVARLVTAYERIGSAVPLATSPGAAS